MDSGGAPGAEDLEALKRSHSASVSPTDSLSSIEARSEELGRPKVRLGGSFLQSLRSALNRVSSKTKIHIEPRSRISREVPMECLPRLHGDVVHAVTGEPIALELAIPKREVHLMLSELPLDLQDKVGIDDVVADCWTNVRTAMSPSGEWHAVPLTALPADKLRKKGKSLEFVGVMIPVGAGSFEFTFRVGLPEQKLISAPGPVEASSMTSDVPAAPADIMGPLDDAEQGGDSVSGSWLWAGSFGQNGKAVISVPTNDSHGSVVPDNYIVDGFSTEQTDTMSLVFAFGAALRAVLELGVSSISDASSGPVESAFVAACLAQSFATASIAFGDTAMTATAQEMAPQLVVMGWLRKTQHCKSLLLSLTGPHRRRLASSLWKGVVQFQNATFKDATVLLAVARSMPSGSDDVDALGSHTAAAMRRHWGASVPGGAGDGSEGDAIMDGESAAVAPPAPPSMLGPAVVAMPMAWSMAPPAGEAASPTAATTRERSASVDSVEGTSVATSRSSKAFGDLLGSLQIRGPIAERTLLLAQDWAQGLRGYHAKTRGAGGHDSGATQAESAKGAYSTLKTPQNEIRFDLMKSLLMTLALEEVPSKFISRAIEALRYAPQGSVAASYLTEMVRYCIDGTAPDQREGAKQVARSQHALLHAQKMVFGAINAAVHSHVEEVCSKPPSWLDSVEDEEPLEGPQSRLRPLLLFLVDALHNRKPGTKKRRKKAFIPPADAMVEGRALSCRTELCGEAGCGGDCETGEVKDTGVGPAPLLCALMHTAAVTPGARSVARDKLRMGESLKPRWKDAKSAKPSRTRLDDIPMAGEVGIRERKGLSNSDKPVRAIDEMDGASTSSGSTDSGTGSGSTISSTGSGTRVFGRRFLPSTRGLLNLCPRDQANISAGVWVDVSRTIASAAAKLCPYADQDYEALLSAAAQIASSCPLARAAVLRRLLQKWVVGTSSNENMLVNFLGIVLNETSARGDLVVPGLQHLVSARLQQCITCERAGVVKTTVTLVTRLSAKLLDLLGEDSSRKFRTALVTSASEHWNRDVRKACKTSLQVLFPDDPVILTLGEEAPLGPGLSRAPPPAPASSPRVSARRRG